MFLGRQDMLFFIVKLIQLHEKFIMTVKVNDFFLMMTCLGLFHFWSVCSSVIVAFNMTIIFWQ